MQDYPNNIISAVERELCYQEDDIAETLSYMANEYGILDRACRRWLDEHDRCERCGAKLEVQRGREYHSEVDAYEPYCEKYCPICDLGG